MASSERSNKFWKDREYILKTITPVQMEAGKNAAQNVNAAFSGADSALKTNAENVVKNKIGEVTTQMEAALTKIGELLKKFKAGKTEELRSEALGIAKYQSDRLRIFMVYLSFLNEELRESGLKSIEKTYPDIQEILNNHIAYFENVTRSIENSLRRQEQSMSPASPTLKKNQ